MRKFVVPIIVMVVGGLISYWAFASLRDVDNARAKTEFDRRSENVSTVLSEGVSGYSTVMESIKNMTNLTLEDSGSSPMDAVDHPEESLGEWMGIKIFFSQMASDSIASFPGFRGLGWAIHSPHDKLDDLEFAGKHLISPEYEIRQVLSVDEFGVVPERDSHFPIFYMEPLDVNMNALGLDLAGAAITREAVIEARDTGRIVSTPPISWIEQRLGKTGFNVFHAVYFNDDMIKTVEDRREHLYAIALGVVMVEDMLNYAMRGLSEEGIEYFVFTGEDQATIESGEEVPVFSSNGNLNSFLDFHDSHSKDGFGFQGTVNVLGRNWSIYSYPTDEFLAGFRTSNSGTIFATGLLITFILAFYLYQSANRTDRIQALVERRTQELSLVNTNLEQEIASRIKAEEHRQELESQLHQSQKMESIGQLAGGVAHDFNNLLVAILGYSELTLTKLDKDSAIYSNVEQIMGAGERAKVLVRQLLAFSRQQVLDLADLNLDTVIADLVKMIERVIGEHITLHVIENKQPQTIRADRGQLEQIILNLCVNARDAMGDGGTLTIETSNQDLDREFCEANTWAIPGKYVQFSVTDMGCGMDADTKSRIFEPFFTTKKIGEGTGLGLSTVFGLVSQHKGLINVYSELGVGSTFKIYFPVVNFEEEREERKPIKLVEDGAGTILFADDDELVRNVTERILADAGYTVITARDGQQAVEVFDKYQNDIDFVLLDVVMPRLGGRAAAEHIHAKSPDLPTLFSTGYSSDAIHTNFVLDQGMHLIQKPYHREELLLTIRELLRERKN
jgi:signal transduction histidine kinase/CheY-like chemotaxis protein